MGVIEEACMEDICKDSLLCDFPVFNASIVKSVESFQASHFVSRGVLAALVLTTESSTTFLWLA